MTASLEDGCFRLGVGGKDFEALDFAGVFCEKSKTVAEKITVYLRGEVNVNDNNNVCLSLNSLPFPWCKKIFRNYIRAGLAG